VTAVQIDEVFGKGQSDAGPLLPAGGGAGLGEPVEDGLLLVLRNPHAGVPHHNLHLILLLSNFDNHTPIGWGKLDRIGEKIAQDVALRQAGRFPLRAGRWRR